MASNSNVEQNVALMKRIVLGIQQDGNFDLIDETTHVDFYNHSAVGGLPTSRAGVHAIMRYIHSAFSNIKMEIVHMVSQGNVIATNKILHGDHTGDWFGQQGDGKRKKFRIMDFVTVEGGQIKEHWANLGSLEPEDV